MTGWQVVGLVLVAPVALVMLCGVVVLVISMEKRHWAMFLTALLLAGITIVGTGLLVGAIG